MGWGNIEVLKVCSYLGLGASCCHMSYTIGCRKKSAFWWAYLHSIWFTFGGAMSPMGKNISARGNNKGRWGKKKKQSWLGKPYFRDPWSPLCSTSLASDLQQIPRTQNTIRYSITLCFIPHKYDWWWYHQFTDGYHERLLSQALGSRISPTQPQRYPVNRPYPCTPWFLPNEPTNPHVVYWQERTQHRPRLWHHICQRTTPQDELDNGIQGAYQQQFQKLESKQQEWLQDTGKAVRKTWWVWLFELWYEEPYGQMVHQERQVARGKDLKPLSCHWLKQRSQALAHLLRLCMRRK